MSRRAWKVGLLALGLGLAAVGCASARPPEEIDTLLARATTRALEEFERGRPEEAAQLVHAIARVDPEREGLVALRSSLGMHEDRLANPWLGSNVRPRLDIERATWERVALYLPDRILDLLDIVSFDVHVGVGAFANVHVTRAVQLGAGGRAVVGLGWHDQRSLGGSVQGEAGLWALPFATEAYGGMLVGTSGVLAGSQGLSGLVEPTDMVFQEYRDYWAVGAGVTLLFVGVDFDLHPVEVADAIVGFTTVDFLHDDLAGTRGLRLNRDDEQILSGLGQVAARPRHLRAYREWAEARRAGS
jgi:hypothetical protein